MDLKLNVSWQGGMQGSGLIDGEGLLTKMSIPAVYGGPGKDSNPKELYVASVAACFISTLAAITDNKKLPLASLSVETEAHEEDTHFSITHHTHIVLNETASEKDFEKAKAHIATADEVCVIGNLARKAGVEVNVNADVTVA